MHIATPKLGSFLFADDEDKEEDAAEDDDQVPLIRQRRSRTPRRSRRSRPRKAGLSNTQYSLSGMGVSGHVIAI